MCVEALRACQRLPGTPAEASTTAAAGGARLVVLAQHGALPGGGGHGGQLHAAAQPGLLCLQRIHLMTPHRRPRAAHSVRGLSDRSQRPAAGGQLRGATCTWHLSWHLLALVRKRLHQWHCLPALTYAGQQLLAHLRTAGGSLHGRLTPARHAPQRPHPCAGHVRLPCACCVPGEGTAPGGRGHAQGAGDGLHIGERGQLGAPCIPACARSLGHTGRRMQALRAHSAARGPDVGGARSPAAIETQRDRQRGREPGQNPKPQRLHLSGVPRSDTPAASAGCAGSPAPVPCVEAPSRTRPFLAELRAARMRMSGTALRLGVGRAPASCTTPAVSAAGQGHRMAL